MSHLPFSSAAEAPDERETLLAYKTAVDFPVRLSQSVTAFPAQSLGVAEPVTIVAAAASASTPDDTVAPATGSSEPGSLATDGSSSSSSSDSDSDSDSEDEKPDVKAETKTSQHELSESTVKKEAEKQDVISKVTEEHKHEKKVPAEPENTPVRAAEAVQEAALAAVVATIEATQTTVETPSVSSEESVDSVPEICSATEDDLEVPSIKVSAEAPVKLTLDIREDAASQAVPDAQTKIVPTETTQPTSAKAPAEAEGTAKTAAEVSDAVESTEALVDCAPVVAEAAGEKLKADTAVEPPEGTHYTTLPPNMFLPFVLRSLSPCR